MESEPVYQPGDTVEFVAALDVAEGHPVEIANDDLGSVVPIFDGSRKFVGVALADGPRGTTVLVELRRAVFAFTATTDVASGDHLTAIADAATPAAEDEAPSFLALNPAPTGEVVQAVAI